MVCPWILIQMREYIWVDVVSLAKIPYGIVPVVTGNGAMAPKALIARMMSNNIGKKQNEEYMFMHLNHPELISYFQQTIFAFFNPEYSQMDKKFIPVVFAVSETD
jgi:hypothetical protein